MKECPKAEPIYTDQKIVVVVFVVVAIVLTATEARFGCLLCREVQPEWDLIAQSWNKGPKPDEMKLLFGTLDFFNGKGTFQKVCLGLELTRWYRVANF